MSVNSDTLDSLEQGCALSYANCFTDGNKQKAMDKLRVGTANGIHDNNLLRCYERQKVGLTAALLLQPFHRVFWPAAHCFCWHPQPTSSRRLVQFKTSLTAQCPSFVFPSHTFQGTWFCDIHRHGLAGHSCLGHCGQRGSLVKIQRQQSIHFRAWPSEIPQSTWVDKCKPGLLTHSWTASVVK